MTFTKKKYAVQELVPFIYILIYSLIFFLRLEADYTIKNRTTKGNIQPAVNKLDYKIREQYIKTGRCVQHNCIIQTNEAPQLNCKSGE